MKLNGWKRIGIVASVVWILGADIYTFHTEVDDDVKTTAFLTQNCLSIDATQAERFSECEKRLDEFIAEASSWEPKVAAFVALVPVPLGWGIAYLILFLVRWIKHGFA